MGLRTNLIALCFLIATPALAAKGGTPILHLTLRTDFAANADPDAEGSLSAKLRQQGHADVQKLRIEVSHLEPEATHHLFVWLRDVVDPVEVLSFDTDANGEASLKLMHLGHNAASGKKFPTGLDPLSDVLAMEIRDEADAVVLDTDLTEPDWLQYLVKRRLDNEGVDADAEATLFMKEHGTKVLFRLRAAHLDANAGYTLAITDVNETVFEATVTTDAEGQLDIKSLPGGALVLYHMTELELLDSPGGVSVLSTELP